MSKHTKGPWSIKYKDTVLSGRTPICIVHCPHEPGPGGSVYEQSDYAVEREANARLIAAAPELLAECKVILDSLTEWKLKPDHMALLSYSQMLKTVIAKATGNND